MCKHVTEISVCLETAGPEHLQMGPDAIVEPMGEDLTTTRAWTLKPNNEPQKNVQIQLYDLN